MGASKDITSTEARSNMTELLSRVRYQEQRYRLFVRGRPFAGLVTLADLEKLEQLDREAKRQS